MHGFWLRKVCQTLMQIKNIVLVSAGNIKTVFIPVNIYNRLQHSVSFFLTRISQGVARLSRRSLDLQGGFWTSGITVCIAEFRKPPVDSMNMRESVFLVRNAG